SSLSLRGCKGVDDKSISGMNLGLVYGIRLSYYNPIFFETGLMYSGKGARLKKSADQYSIRMHMLEVPFVFKYSIETNVPELSIQPFLGGFASLGVGGSYKDFQEREKHSTFTAGSFQNFDMGFRLGCGVQFQVFYFELSYDIGLINMARSNAYNLTKHINYDDFDDKIRTGNLSLSLGVNF
ncbi:MAG: outer membrane beta-barrel protein, partial [Bacteroidaceae bacterium]|nr:outer membrane beta-barrel protein [Bacteroidaceae bacterium]